MKQFSTHNRPKMRSSDTLYRPDFMLQPAPLNRLAKTQLVQRKAVNASKSEETELIEIAWWQDR